MKRGMLWILVLLLALPVVAPALAQEEAAEEADITIGLLPTMNIYPLLANRLGYFEELGVNVEFKALRSAAALREGIASGELDGYQADLITTLVLRSEGQDVRLVRHVGLVSPPFFGLLTMPDSGIMSVADLAGKQIGISKRTVVQFVTDLMLEQAGVDPTTVEYVNIPTIRERHEMLENGEIVAATLPQPLYELSVQAGAIVLVDDSVLDYVPEAISILSTTLAEKRDQVSAFLSGYERALLEVNARHSYEEGMAWFSGELREQVIGGIRSRAEDSSNLAEYFRIIGATMIWPSMTTARVPTEAEFDSVHEWALRVGLLSEAQAYEDVVDGSYLPEAMDEEMADDGDDMADGDE